MRACPGCGEQAPEGARFCPVCGTALFAAPVPEGLRKVVTIVFCDLVGSTKLAEELDLETLRQVLARYFDAMSEVLMRHEGAIQQFIGDAVLAVFGMPTVHEDDAVRAVRAAAEMRVGAAGAERAARPALGRPAAGSNGGRHRRGDRREHCGRREPS